jgi:RarD protein
MKKDIKKGLLEMLGATFLWGSTPLMGIYSNLPSGVFVFFRVLFAFPFIFYFAVKRAGIKEFFNLKPFWPLFFSGVMLGVNWIFFFLAVKMTEVSTAVTIYYAGPIISMLLAALFLKEKLTKWIILGAFLAFLGVVVSVKGDISADIGSVMALFAAISYALLGFFSKIAVMYHRAVSVTAWQILISVFITLPFLFLNDWSLSVEAVLIAFITGVVHTAVALFLWYDALNYIKVSLSAVLQYLDIIFAILLAWIFLSQFPDFYQITGAVLIIIAGIISVLKN